MINAKRPSEWYDQFSSYDRLVRVVAYINRFINDCRKRPRATVVIQQRSDIDDSIRILVTESQRCFFTTLTHELSTGSSVSSKQLSKLRPFLDPSGVICVGRRLLNSDLPYGCKHPMLLAKESHLSTLICRRRHRISCHAGPQIMTALISRDFWIVAIKSILHRVTRACPVCVRFDGKPPQPIMADLPAARSGSDIGTQHAGPIQMREVRLRKLPVNKAYIAVFVCFSVKTVHLEVVTELSTEAFLAAFDSPDGQDAITQSHSACQWHFNPQSAPHFGGLWEAAVRSAKRLLIRTMGTHVFNYEEFTTLLTRVETVLNSRPLTPLTTVPANLDYLYPGHF
ncbi:uncharacterized protein LOC112592112 [Melanaphis sacchari]|uniref:uncharacterized protein LOC112592112 n=1 Tax=Melanaphis sacchari TaxID=742174 RepID=UPI000DC140CA|nr:uncharacterized protein LOC112592112 [Melanaphis sacchari]